MYNPTIKQNSAEKLNMKSQKGLPIDQTWIVLGFIIVLPMVAFLIVLIFISSNPVWIAVVSVILGLTLIILVILLISNRKKIPQNDKLKKNDIKYITNKMRNDNNPKK